MKPKLITVDKHNLEQEWTDQPGAMHYCLIQWAEALKVRREVEAEVDVIMAEQDALVRQALEDAGEKATETAVKRLIQAAKPYIKALKESAQAAHEVHLIEAERFALEHKKAALENLTKLRLADWYSEPKRPGKRADEEKDVEGQRAGLNDRKPRKRPQRVK